jgi:hypothetical protein
MVYLTAYMRSRGANQVHVVGGAAASVAKQRRAPLYVLQRAAQWHSLTLSHTYTALYRVSGGNIEHMHYLRGWALSLFACPGIKCRLVSAFPFAAVASSVCYVEPKHFVYMRFGAISLSGENGFKSADGCQIATAFSGEKILVFMRVGIFQSGTRRRRWCI